MAIICVKGRGLTEEDWSIAGKIDVNGIHKVKSTPAINAFYTWSEDKRLFAPRDGAVLDCSEFFNEAINFINNMSEADIRIGEEWAKKKAHLDKSSMINNDYAGGRIMLRQADVFVNHLYRSNTEVIVGFNTKTKAITVSFADPIPGLSRKDLVQARWEPEAGGHDTIAGPHRGVEYTIEDADDLCWATRKVMS